jgi:hypothetical protein
MTEPAVCVLNDAKGEWMKRMKSGRKGQGFNDRAGRMFYTWMWMS